MVKAILQLGRTGIDVCQLWGQAGIFLARTVFRRPLLKKNFPLFLAEVYSSGVLSLLIIVVSGLFIGMVVGLQGHNTLDKFGSSSQLGQVVALTITRELGPVITALLFAGRAGSAMTAEIGLMKATEQLSSMDMMGVDPLGRVIWPRFWAGMISMPLLMVIFSAVAVFGGYLIGVEWLGVDQGIFWNNMRASVEFYDDVMSGVYKSIVFAFVVTWIAVFQGFNAVPTAQGIGRATTSTVVYSSLSVLGLDFLLTSIMIGGW